MFNKSQGMGLTTYYNPKKNFHFYGVIILFLLIPLISVIAYMFVPEHQGGWQAPLIHTVFEAFGSVMAFFIAIFLLKREKLERSDYFVQIAIAFISMGILDAFHSGFSAGQPFVFLRCMASLMGSLIFALVWIPVIKSTVRHNIFVFLLPVLISFALGFFTIFFPQTLPQLINNHEYTGLANNIHLLAGILFLLSALKFTIDYQKTQTFESFMLLCLALLFSLAELTFGQAKAWNAQWWFFHILRLTAYLVMLRFLFSDYESMVDKLNLYLFQSKKSEERLKHEHERLLAIFDNMDESIYVADPNTYQLLYLNNAAKKLWGSSEGKLCYQTIHSFNKPCSFCTNKEIFGKNQGKAYVWEYYHEKTKKWFRNIDRSIPWTDGRMVRFEMAVNIDDAKKIEQAINETTAMKTKFISMASHELRTPLATIQESVNIVLDGIVGSLTDKQTHILSITRNNIKRLSRLVNDILDFQRLQAGKMSFDLKPENLHNIISESCESMASMANNKKLYIQLEFAKNVPQTICDKDKITQVLFNILHNALKFTEQGGVTIITKQKNNMILTSISDTGPGISSQNLKDVFKAFEQLRPNENTETKGTGLGLAICKKIINEHKGKIWATSKEGKGTSFYFSLPLA